MQSYKVDNGHSSVYFKVMHKGLSYTYGRFNQVKGDVNFDENDLTNSSFDIAIATSSVDTNHAGRDKHLRNADFFNANRYKEITFKSKSIAKTDKKDIYSLTGDLTLHGKTNSITVKIKKIGQKGKTIGFDTNFSINRSDYNMGKMVGPIGDKIDINFSFESNSK